jgi:mannosyltransferase
MRAYRILLLILLLATVLRLWGLGSESLWLDEALTARHMETSYVQLVHDFLGNTQTILYYLGEKAWCMAFGHTEAALRFPSVIYGVLTVWAIFLLAGQLFSRAAALWTAFLLAINPFAIYYSQEARPYAMFLLAAVFSLFFLLRFLRSPRKGAAWGYVISATIALYAHPLGPLLLLVHGAMIVLFREKAEWRYLRQTMGLMAAVVILYLPQLILMWAAVINTIRGKGAASWIPAPALRDIVETFRQYFMSPYLAGLAFAMLIFAVIVVLRRGRADRRSFYLCAMLFFAFVPLLWIVSILLTPLYVHRFTIPALASVMLILGWGFAAMKWRWRVVALCAYLLLTVHALFYYYTMIDKEPWRHTAQIVREIVQPGDAIILNAPYTQVAFEYYFPVSPYVTMIAPWSVGGIPAGLNTARHVVLVRAYPFTKQAITDSLYARAARGRLINPTVRVNDLSPQNPWSYWIPDIWVTRYDCEP